MPGSDKFLPEQKANVVLWYAVCGDPKTVQHKFKAVYGRQEHHIDPPSDKQIEEWYKNFRHIGFIDIHDAVIHEEATGELMPHMDEQHRSKIGQTMAKVWHKLSNTFLDGPAIRNFHPYHMELIKSCADDWEERKHFAKDQLEHIHKWAPILKSMWFTGEAKFFPDGRVECHNLVYTTAKKPDERDDLPHKITKQYHSSDDKPHLTVWAAMNSEVIIGPFFFEEEITSEAYKEVLKKFVDELHKISSEMEHPIFVQDDSKIHSNLEVIEFLDQEFPNRWTGSCSKYSKWPHHSNDLMPVNFFLWGYIKSRVYKTEIVGGVDELKQRVEAAFKNITKDLLEEAVEEYKTRLERVVKTNGHLVDATVYGEEIDYDALKVWGTYAWPYM